MKNDACFLDTSGWIAFLNGDDRNHASAVEAYVAAVSRGRILVVTDWVVAETGNGLAGGGRRELFAKSPRTFMAAPNVRIVDVDKGLIRRSLDLYEARPDKAWGLVDCASFVVMTEHGIRDAFTLDRHFEQAGFRRPHPGPGGADRRDG